MQQNFQQKLEFRCKNHPQTTAIFWCKSVDCLENRIFCLQCQKIFNHSKHFFEDVEDINQLNQFLITKSQSSKDLITECQLQFQSNSQSFESFISGLQYKFSGIEDKINELAPNQASDALDSLIQFEKMKNQIKTNIIGSLEKFQKNLDDLFIQLELHLIKYQITEQQRVINQNEYQKALSLSIVNKQNEAIQILDRLLLTDPYNLEIMYQKGNSLMKLNQFEDAQQIYTEIIKINPLHELSQWKIEIKCFISKLNSIMINVYQLIKIIQQLNLEQVNVQQQYLTLIQYNIRETYQYNQALEYYVKAIEINQTNKVYLLSYGDCLRELERYQEAINVYDQCLKQDSNYADAYAGKGICLLWLNMFEDAENNLKKSLNLKQNCTLGYLGYGLFLLRKSQYENAIQYFEIALNINPQHNDSLSRIGDCLRLMNDYQQALEWYQKALDINPQHINSLWGKAYCLIQFGQYQNAYTLLVYANQLLPNNQYIKELLIQCAKSL